jgi:hypothetical protein
MDKLKTKRVQLDLALESHDRLNKLKDQIEATSYVEVFRNALKLYEYIIKCDQEGKSFYIGKEGEQPIQCKIFV